MSTLRRQTISATLALLFVSMALPGCLSLVIGRELMEGARGMPETKPKYTSYDLSHTWQNSTELDDYQESKTQLIPIDHTVQEILIQFQVSIRNDDIDDLAEPILEALNDAGITQTNLAQRYVEVWLYPCEVMDDCDYIYHERTNGSFEQTQTKFTTDNTTFKESTWRLVVEGQGVDASSVPFVGFQDSWLLILSVKRPCVEFPESSGDEDECIPKVDLE
ncbi:MAG: hypothetical protein QF440_03350 [Candidatus Thalassarchaeaceae archaeon]|nr:hypothetical protein [Candidatus Thalassarchaeaceae archaeon]